MKRILLTLTFVLLAGAAIAQDGLIYSPDWVPPPCGGIYSDVPCPGTVYAPWAEQLFREGITVGTQAPGDPISFSPSLPIPREQEAVFILKAEHSILERFAVGQVTCQNQEIVTKTSWAKCQSTRLDPRVHANSTVMLTYRTRGSDDQIPARVIDIFDGSFTYEQQTGQTVDYLAYIAEEFPPIQ